MITQEITASLLMKQEENLILRVGDIGNKIKFKFDDLRNITSAEIRIIKPDDTFVIAAGTLYESYITFDVTEQMCTVPGKGRYNIRLMGEDLNVYTYVGWCIIDINLDLENAVESVAESNGLIFPDDFLTSADMTDYATKSYVNNAISQIHIGIDYSTTEQDTGLKWIDGKDRYQITVEYTNSSVDLTSLNIDNVTNIEGVAYLLDGTIFLLNTYASSQYNVNIDITNNVLRMSMSGWDFAKAYITLSYTKTTD